MNAATTPESWRRIESLLEATLECPVSQRGRFLDSACGEDADLRLEVEKLVEAYEGAGSFLESSAVRRLIPTGRRADGRR